MVQMSAGKLVVLTVCVFFVIGANVQEAMSRPAPDPEMAAMAEALKMLQQLDRRYQQIAKPRPRSEAPMRRDGLLHLLELDRQYAHLTKPRFGRSLNPHPYRDMADSDSASYNQQEASDEYRR